MDDHDDHATELARYGSAVARFYIWVGICICYLWVVFGVVIGLLIMKDGSKLFGAGVIALGLIAWKIAGRLKRLKNGGD